MRASPPRRSPGVARECRWTARRGGVERVPSLCVHGERFDALDDEPVAVPEHEELARGGDAARGGDDEAVAFPELGLHGVPAHPEDAQRLGLRVALVAHHRLGQAPAGLLEHEVVVPGAGSCGGLDLGDGGGCGAPSFRPGPGLGRRQRVVAELAGVAAEELTERFGVPVPTLTSVGGESQST